jgi:hypothetical protein
MQRKIETCTMGKKFIVADKTLIAVKRRIENEKNS